MDNFFALFRRYLNDKAKGNEIEWSRIAPPKPEQVVDYNQLGNSESVEFLSKLAVQKAKFSPVQKAGLEQRMTLLEGFVDTKARQDARRFAAGQLTIVVRASTRAFRPGMGMDGLVGVGVGCT